MNFVLKVLSLDRIESLAWTILIHEDVLSCKYSCNIRKYEQYIHVVTTSGLGN
jgi:hypothetical protein